MGQASGGSRSELSADRTARWSLHWTMLAIVVLIGAVAAGVAWEQENRSAAVRQRGALSTVAAATSTATDNAVAALAGATALVDPDDTVSDERVDAFAADLIAYSGLQAVAVAEVVPAAQRAEFEAEIGAPVIDLSEEAITRAEDRDTYWALRRIAPEDDFTSVLLGLDLAANPITAAPALEARNLGRTRITAATRIALPSPDAPDELVDTAVFFILNPLYEPGAPIDTAEQRRVAHVGFVVTALTGDNLAASIESSVPDGVIVRISDGGTVLTGPSGTLDGVSSRQDILGRSWEVQLDDRRGVDHGFTILLVSVTAVLLIVLSLVVLRDRRHATQRARVTWLVGRTAELAKRLSAAATAEEVATVIGDDLPPLFDAQAASFGLVRLDRGTVELRYGSTMSPIVSAAYPEYPLDAAAPVTDSIRDGVMHLIEDEAQWRAAVPPDVAAHVLGAGIKAMASLPLAAPDGTVIASIGIFWNRRERFDDLTVATLETITELCEQSLERASSTDRSSDRAEALARLAERLASAGSIEETARIILDHARQPVLASAVSIGVIDEQAGVLRVDHGETVVEEMSSRYSDPPLDSPLAFTDAARSGRPVLVETFDDYLERYPSTDPANAELGRGARAALPMQVAGRPIGSIVFAWDHDLVFGDELLFSLSTIAELASQAVHRARLTSAQELDARRSRALAAFAQGLAVAQSSEQLAEFVAQEAGEPLDAGFVALLLAEGATWSATTSPSIPDDPAVLAKLGGDPSDPAGPLVEAALGGGDVLLGDAHELRERYPGLAAGWQELGISASASLVLRDRDGEPIGAIGIGWGAPVVFDPEVRDTITTVVRMVEQSVQRSRLTDQLRSDADRNEQLARFARRLANVRTVDQLRAAVKAHGGDPVGAAVANIGLVDAERNQLVVEADDRLDSGTPWQVQPRSLDDHLPGTDAVRTLEPVVIESLDDARARYPGRFAELMAAHGLQSSVHLPLAAPDGEASGCIGFAWPHPQRFRPTKLARLRTVTELCAQTLQRARLGDAEHRIVDSIHRRVVSEVPSMRGLELSARYLPAAPEVGMGGDWYDALVLDEHRYALVVGDVAGHGIGAVADMMELRAITGALLQHGVPLEGVFERVSTWLMGADTIATACISVIDTERDVISHVSAGHLPPVVRRPDGSVHMLTGGRQPLLGLPGRIPQADLTEFPPGSVLVVCTDGLIERRQRPIDESLDELAALVQETGADHGGVDGVADRLLDRCLAGRIQEDDVALVVIARVDAGVVERTFQPDPAEISSARAFVSAAVEHTGVRLDDVGLVTSELATNAVRHAGTAFTVRVETSSDAVRVGVRDAGAGRPAPAARDTSAIGGRGLLIIDELSDAWGVTELEGGKWVWARFGSFAPTTPG